MKVDITSMFFNSKIEGKTATPAWRTSIGQNKSKECRIETDVPGVSDMIIGMTYKMRTDLHNLDKTGVSGDLMLCAVFNKIFVNNTHINGGSYTLLLLRETSESHEGRLQICYAPKVSFHGKSNSVTIEQIRETLGCSTNGCWFVYEISIKNQDELHFSAIVVDKNQPAIYTGTSQDRSKYWKSLIPAENSKISNTSYLPYLTALRTKPFMLLAGISGTGKSRIVRKLAQATNPKAYANEDDRWKDNRPENFELIQVKPNWHNSMDVVGYMSNIPAPHYVFTDFVRFIVKAWQHKDTPYFLCLDEMNLAPVEEYFAEFLSAIESRALDEKGEYITDPIIAPFKEFAQDVREDMLRQLLGEALHTETNPLAIQFTEKGLTLPPNLMVMGTVNMDETTFSFSRKVLDRAMSIEMNEVNFDDFKEGKTELMPLLTEQNELLVKRPQKACEVQNKIDCDRVIKYLTDVNALLDGTPFKLGYRAANEAILYVSACQDFAGEDFRLEKALDEFTLMKILSRIEGDDSRLSVDERDERLRAACIDSNAIEDGEQSLNLLNCLRAIVKKHIGQNTETERKINRMYHTLMREHFVSYWN